MLLKDHHHSFSGPRAVPPVARQPGDGEPVSDSNSLSMSTRPRTRPVFASRRRRRRTRAVRVGLVLLLLAAIAWGEGLLWFIGRIPQTITAPYAQTDAIVVLTGGSERLSTGLALLAEEWADKLFVSGVYRGVDVAELLRLQEQAPEELKCCINLGYVAGDTVGNAEETRAWIQEQGYHSLRLVTANYHMPRSLAEFRRAMPEVEIIPHPVFPDSVKMAQWWQYPGTTRLLASEYNKFLLSAVRHWVWRGLHSLGWSGGMSLDVPVGESP